MSGELRYAINKEIDSGNPISDEFKTLLMSELSNNNDHDTPYIRARQNANVAILKMQKELGTNLTPE